MGDNYIPILLENKTDAEIRIRFDGVQKLIEKT
jgi:hypothetical protein